MSAYVTKPPTVANVRIICRRTFSSENVGMSLSVWLVALPMAAERSASLVRSASPASQGPRYSRAVERSHGPRVPGARSRRRRDRGRSVGADGRGVPVAAGRFDDAVGMRTPYQDDR